MPLDRPALLAGDAILADSDKTYTVSAGQKWLIDSVFVHFVATTDAGSRQILLDFANASAALIGRFVHITAIIAEGVASITFCRDASSAAAGTSVATTPAVVVSQVAIPRMVLLPGYTIRVRDAIAVDVDGDNMTVRIYGQRVVA